MVVVKDDVVVDVVRVPADDDCVIDGPVDGVKGGFWVVKVVGLEIGALEPAGLVEVVAGGVVLVVVDEVRRTEDDGMLVVDARVVEEEKAPIVDVRTVESVEDDLFDLSETSP